MKQSLQLRVGQSLTMTPQLQQAIRLLQLSTLDLQQEIQSALDSNPLLEISDDDGDIEVNIEPTSAEPKKPEKTSDNEIEATLPEADTEWAERSDIPEDLPVDSQWDDVFQTSGSGSSSGSGASGEDNDYNNDYRNSSSDSLQDHLRWQLNLSRLSDIDQMIAAAIIDAIDEKGRLTVSPEELVEGFNSDAIEIEEVNAVLHLIQQFDPPGVGGRDLQECLLIQLKQLPQNTPYAEEACLVVSQYMAQLGNRDYNQIMRRCRLKEEQLRDILKLIQSLDPTPGNAIGSDDTEYVIPDVFVSKKEGRWLVELNPDIAPKIQINAQYASMARKSSNSSDNDYIRDNLQEARWFIKSLISRNETLMKVATKIVEYQRGFLEYGEEAMCTTCRTRPKHQKTRRRWGRPASYTALRWLEVRYRTRSRGPPHLNNARRGVLCLRRTRANTPTTPQRSTPTDFPPLARPPQAATRTATPRVARTHAFTAVPRASATRYAGRGREIATACVRFRAAVSEFQFRV